MERCARLYIVISVLLSICSNGVYCKNVILTTEDLENFINPDDLQMIYDYYQMNPSEIESNVTEAIRPVEPLAFGCLASLDSIITRIINKLYNNYLRPPGSQTTETQFFFLSREIKFRVQVLNGDQFGLESVHFDPKRKTVAIIHGFMSYSGADWVTQMMDAYLKYEPVNVIAVDWSSGSSTLKYWEAVANTRIVGKHIASFIKQLQNETGLDIKDIHLIGHSLGAHIAAFASNELGGVGRVTGLDPAMPCFTWSDKTDRLDKTDADFVDVIHTNGKLSTIGFGLPLPMGHVDFYPNGGETQPGCLGSRIPLYNRLQQAICSHGRSYVLFTESFTNRNCKFYGSPWNLKADGVKTSVAMSCSDNTTLCPEMGVGTSKEANGIFLVLTKAHGPYCVLRSSNKDNYEWPELVDDIMQRLRNGELYVVSSGTSLTSMFTAVSGWFGKLKDLFR